LKIDLHKSIRWIGGATGWLLGGAVGGVTGFIAGGIIDNIRNSPFGKTGKPSMGAFSVSLLTLFAVVMQSDGKVVRSELNSTKLFIRQHFGEKDGKEALHTLRRLLSQHQSVQNACRQVQRYIDDRDRLQLYVSLAKIARIDGPVTASEQQMLDTIAVGLNIHLYQLNQLNTGVKPKQNPVDAAYADLGVSRKATIKEIKQAYHSLAVKCHPDKVIHLNESAGIKAKEQFQKINKAYELIKNECKFS
jgi:DnaJ like chaperone protein